MPHFYRLLISSTLILFVTELKAQRYAFDQGSLRLSLSLNYSNSGGDLYQPKLTENIERDRATEFSLRPSLAYFFLERLAIGADLTYVTDTQNDKNNRVTLFSQTSWSVGPSVAYFFGERQSPIFPFVAASYAYQSFSKQEFEDGTNIRATGTTLRVSGGMAIMFGKQASLNVEAFYRVDTRKVQGVSRSGNVFGLEVGASLFIF